MLIPVISDLLSNPFAVLGLTCDANAGRVTARARELGGSEASAASRPLLIPRARLLAELRHLPGASPEIAQACFEALKDGREPDLWALTPLARANVLAHLALSKKATASQLRDLAGLQDAIRSATGPVIDAARAQAQMAPVPAEMLGDALEELAGEHAEAFTAGMLALPNGAEMLTEQLQAAGTEASARASFLRQAAAAWERATAAEMAREMESGSTIESQLAKEPTEDLARQLASIVRRYAAKSRPPRESSRMLGLVHRTSADAARRWRTVALELNNEQDAVAEAVILLEALADGFGITDELGALVAKDLKVCQERLALGEGRPEIRRLIAALEGAAADPRACMDTDMVGGSVTRASPPVVRELHDAFVAATRGASSDLPWRLLRSFALRLHNEFSSTDAAIAFTQLAIRQGAGIRAAAEAVRIFEEDLRTLRREQAKAQLAAALQTKKNGKARQVLSTLIGLADDAKEKSEYQKLQRTIADRQGTQAVRLGLLALVAIFVVFSLLSGNSGPRTAANGSPPPTSAGAYSSAYSPSYSSSPTPSPPVDPDAGRPERQPSAGDSALARAELRWCEFQDARSEGANNYLETIRSTPGVDPGKFNSAVAVYNRLIDALNSSCRGHKYWSADKTVIDLEVDQHRSDLRAAGQALIMAAYGAVPKSTNPAPRSVGSAAVPGYSAPSSALPPPSFSASPSFAQGLSDRQAWEAWLNSQEGGFRDGAEWWASIRSSAGPPSCAEAPGSDRQAAVSGCNAARAGLSPFDSRRKADPEYRAGWNSLVVASSESRAYQQGVADRQSWEAWFSSLTGGFRDGAEWWSGVRSAARPPACNDAPGYDRVNAVAGCNAARARLAGPERRRRTEPDYRAGWNSL